MTQAKHTYWSFLLLRRNTNSRNAAVIISSPISAQVKNQSPIPTRPGSNQAVHKQKLGQQGAT